MIDDISSKAKQLAENKNVRIGGLGLAIGLAIYLVVVKDSGNKRERIFIEKPESVYSISKGASEIEAYEVKSLVEDMNDKLLSKEREFESKDALRQQEMRRLQEQNMKLQESMFELSNLIKAANNSPQGTVVGGDNNSATQYSATDDPTALTKAPMDNTFYRPNNNIVSQAPQSFGNNIIRTVTQRQISEMRKSGEVEIKDTGVTTIEDQNKIKLREQVAERKAIDKAEELNKKNIQNKFTLVQGSIVTAVALNGVAAPTGANAASEPMPVMFRIKKEAIMPNYFSLDVRECHILGSASGRLRDKRVYIRTDSISCITNDGIAIEEPMKAVATSRGDGLLGIPGTVVFTGQELLENTMYAGLLSGFADAAKPQRVQSLNTDPSAEALWQGAALDRYAFAGIGEGVSKAGDTLAQFYMQLANQVSPVIELLPGIEVDFIVTGSTTFNLGE